MSIGCREINRNLLLSMQEAEALTIADASNGLIPGAYEALVRLAIISLIRFGIPRSQLEPGIIESTMSFALQHYQFNQSFPYSIAEMTRYWLEEERKS